MCIDNIRTESVKLVSHCENILALGKGLLIASIKIKISEDNRTTCETSMFFSEIKSISSKLKVESFPNGTNFPKNLACNLANRRILSPKIQTRHAEWVGSLLLSLPVVKLPLSNFSRDKPHGNREKKIGGSPPSNQLHLARNFSV